MKAIEFIKKFGWTVTKDLSNRDNTSIGYLSVEHHGLNQQEFKRYIDAYEFVAAHNGVQNAIKYINTMDGSSGSSHYNSLRAKVKLVEEVENYNDV